MRVWAPVAGAVGPRAADQGDARKILIERQLDVEVVLVIPQPNIEAWSMPLDHGLLEHERLLLGGGRVVFKFVYAREQGGDVLRQDAGGVEVVRHAGPHDER